MIDKTLEASETLVRAFQDENLIVILVALIIVLIGLISSVTVLFAKFVISQKQKDLDLFEKKYIEQLNQNKNLCIEKNHRINELEKNYQAVVQNVISITSNHANFINATDKEITRANTRMSGIEKKIEDIAETQVEHNESQIRAFGKVETTLASLLATSNNVTITPRNSNPRNVKKYD